VIDENGYVRDYRQTDNVIVNAGWNELVRNTFTGIYDPASALQDVVTSPFSHIGIGSADNTDLPLDVANIGLGAELACPRESIGISSAGASIGVITVTLSVEFDASTDAGCQSADIDEAGLFNGTLPSGTAMFARNTFATVPQLGPFDFLEIDWDFTFNTT